MSIIKVIIPAYNEAESIPHVIKDIPDFVDEIIVVSNNSTDDTEANAKNAGATVLVENQKGYGYACLKGMDYVSQQTEKPDNIAHSPQGHSPSGTRVAHQSVLHRHSTSVFDGTLQFLP